MKPKKPIIGALEIISPNLSHFRTIRCEFFWNENIGPLGYLRVYKVALLGFAYNPTCVTQTRPTFQNIKSAI